MATSTGCSTTLPTMIILSFYALGMNLMSRENIGRTAANGQPLSVKSRSPGQAYSFYITTEAGQWQPVARQIDGRILSTPVASGFVGAHIGMYASSNGQTSNNKADFDWFEYSSQE